MKAVAHKGLIYIFTINYHYILVTNKYTASKCVPWWSLIFHIIGIYVKFGIPINVWAWQIAWYSIQSAIVASTTCPFTTGHPVHWGAWYNQEFSTHGPLPEGYSNIFKYVIFKHFDVDNVQNSFCEIALSWMLTGLIHDKSILVQVMVWCRHAASHFLNQCWPRFMSSHRVTRLVDIY